MDEEESEEEMKYLIITSATALLLFLYLMVYSLCKISKQSDEAIAKQIQREAERELAN